MGEPANEYHIQAVRFEEESLEISFYETRHLSDDVMTLQQMLIRPTLFVDEINSIKEDIADILDRAYIHRRNPTMRGVPAREVEGELESE